MRSLGTHYSTQLIDLNFMHTIIDFICTVTVLTLMFHPMWIPHTTPSHLLCLTLCVHYTQLLLMNYEMHASFMHC